MKRRGNLTRRALVIRPIVPQLSDGVNAGEGRFYRAILAMLAIHVINDVLMRHALVVNPNDVIALVHVIAACDFQLVRAVQRFGMRCAHGVQSPKVRTETREARKADSPN